MKCEVSKELSGQKLPRQKALRPVGFNILKQTKFKYHRRTAKFCIYVEGSCAIIPVSFSAILWENCFLWTKKWCFTVFYQYNLHQIYFPSNWKLYACEDIFPSLVMSDAIGGRLLNANHFVGLFVGGFLSGGFYPRTV